MKQPFFAFALERLDPHARQAWSVLHARAGGMSHGDLATIPGSRLRASGAVLTLRASGAVLTLRASGAV